MKYIGWLGGWVLVLVLVPVVADAAVLSIFPERGNATVGESLRLEVGVDTEGERINTVQAWVIVPPELTVVGVETGGSLLDLWIEPPHYDAESGLVQFVGGLSGGFAGKGFIGSIIVEPRELGEVSVGFDQSSVVLLHDGAGTPAAIVREGTSFSVRAAPDLVVESTTHPRDTWSGSQTAVVQWTPRRGVAYSWSLDASPESVPDTTPEEAPPPLEIQGLGDGMHYFHIREGVPNDTGEYAWSESVHLRLLVDTTAPRVYEPMRIDSGTVLVPARDESAGIEAVTYRWHAAWFPPGGPWHTLGIAEPVPVPALLRWFGGTLTTRAVDGAGNAREQTLAIPGNSVAKVVGVLILIIVVLGVLRSIMRKFRARAMRS